jgi:hypothetical protein
MDDDVTAPAEETLKPAGKPIAITDYLAALKAFDIAVCEAIAVSQAIAGRMATPHVGYATRIFTKICCHAIAIIRAVPRSRWVRSDSEFWDFTAIAGYCRSIIEGQLLLWYVIKKPENDEEWSARLNVMHLNDCSRRIKILGDVIDSEHLKGLSAQADEIRSRLTQNNWFCKLDQGLRKRLLSGDPLKITARDEQLEELSWDKKEFYMLWHFLSQYAHILPLSFYRLEANGRGTGIENDTDRGYLHTMFELCTKILAACVDRMVKEFPDAASVRRGINSKFSPGPAHNLPRSRRGR